MEHVTGIFKWVYNIGDILAKLMYINILWFLFTVVGLGLFGFFPATAATYAIYHKIYEDKLERSIFQTFFESYKTFFVKVNIQGWIVAAIGAFLFLDLYVNKKLIQSTILHIILLFFCFLYIIATLYFIPIFIRYELKGSQYMKQALLMALSRPFETIAILISLYLLYNLFIMLQVIFLFMGISLIASTVMWFVLRALKALEVKKIGNEMR